MGNYGTLLVFLLLARLVNDVILIGQLASFPLFRAHPTLPLPQSRI